MFFSFFSGYSHYQHRCVKIRQSSEFRPPYLDEIKVADIFRDLSSKDLLK